MDIFTIIEVAFNVMLVEANIRCQFSVVTFIITTSVLGLLFVMSVILLVIQHLRFRQFKRQTGQLLSKSLLALMQLLL